LPIRFSEHNAFANCHFASANGECTAFAYHSPQVNALALPFAEANGKWRMKGGRRRLGFADFNAEAKWRMQNNPLTFSAYMRHRQGKPRKAPGGLLSVGPRGGGCARSPLHLDHRRSGRVDRHQPIDCQQEQQEVSVIKLILSVHT